MNELAEAQMEYIRALKCNMCDSRLLIERINASNSFFNVPGSSNVNIPEN